MEQIVYLNAQYCSAYFHADMYYAIVDTLIMTENMSFRPYSYPCFGTLVSDGWSAKYVQLCTQCMNENKILRNNVFFI